MMRRRSYKSNIFFLHLLVCVSVVIYLDSHHRLPRLPHTLLSVIASRASPDKYIILSTVDLPIIDMAFNLYESSFKPHNIDNFLFIGFDPDVCDPLTDAGIPCFHYSNVTTEGPAVFNSRNFLLKMVARNTIIRKTLTAGYNVILTDLDVVFLVNPLPDIMTKLRDADVTAIWDHKEYNAGFFAIKSNMIGIKLWEWTCRLTSVEDSKNDQQAFNLAIKRLQKEGEDLRVVRLDESQFACGQHFFEVTQPFPNEPRGCYDNNTSNCAKVVHNNWIVSHEAKVYRFREHLLWYYDKDGYYSSDSTRYLVYKNPPEPHEQQLEALITALTIGRILERVVILPRFHCGDIVCPLNNLTAISAFDSKFAGLYRESSFLRHPKVPIGVRESVSPIYNIIDIARTNNPSIQVAVTSKEILEKLSSISSRVLSLGFLYNVRVTFISNDEQRLVDASMKDAIVECDYRQLKLIATTTIGQL